MAKPRSRVKSMAGLMLDKVNENAFNMHPKVVEVDLDFRSESDLIDEKY